MQTAGMLAAAFGHWECLELLDNAGCMLKGSGRQGLKDRRRRSCVMLAALHGHDN